MGALNEEIEAHGYAFLSEFRPDDLSERSILALGRIAEFCRDRPVHEIIPHAQHVESPNTYSGRYGLGAFPLHTDLAHWPLPPRFVLLRCKIGFPDVPTRLLDGNVILDEVGRSTAFRTLVRPRRPVSGALPLLRLLSRPSPTTECLRWDETYLRPASPAGTLGFGAFVAALNERQAASFPLACTGDTLIFDNWRMLHGRSPVPIGRDSRVLQRAYLEDIT